MSKKVHIHAGHWINKAKGQNGGANGIINEVKEARKIADALTDKLGSSCIKYQDDKSTSQAQNLNVLVSEINKSGADFALSIHFNSSGGGTLAKEIGTETWVYSDKRYGNAKALNTAMVNAMGSIDRGVKYSKSLAVLRATNIPVYLIEVCFVNSKADVDKYHKNFDKLVGELYKQLCKMLGISTSTSKDESKGEATTVSKVHNHKVTKGETLYSIAQSYKTTVAKIKKDNKLTKDLISIGQVLKVIK